MIVQLILSSILLYLILGLLVVIRHNYYAMQFFEKKIPNLPVVPNPSIFFGSIRQVIDHGKFYLVMDKFHKMFGPSFGFYFVDKPWVATKDLDLIRKVFVDESDKHINRSFFHSPVDEFRHSILQNRDEEWRRTRKVVAPCLTNHKLKGEQLGPEIDNIYKKHKAALDDRIKEKQSITGEDVVEVDVNRLSKRSSLSVILLILFGNGEMVNFKSKKDIWTERAEVAAVKTRLELVIAASAFPFIRYLIKFFIYLGPLGDYFRLMVETTKGAMARDLGLRKSTDLAVKEGKKFDNGSNKSLVDNLMAAYRERKLELRTFLSTVCLIIPAGSDTTAGAVSGIIWNLVQDEELQEKIRRVILEQGIESDYITWCAYEAVRWFPPVLFGVGRELGADVTHNGITFPAGTTIVPSEYSIHRDPEIWHEPEKFRPERFKDLAKMHPAAFSAFGHGPRTCVGEMLSIYEIKLMLRLLLTNYKLEKSSKTPKEYKVLAPGLFWYYLENEFSIKISPLKKA